MKIYFILFILFTLSSFSCDDDTPATTTNFIQATIEGSSWKAEDLLDNFNIGNVVGVSGYEEPYGVVVNVPADVKAGTTITTKGQASKAVNGEIRQFITSDASVTISLNTGNRLEGTFLFNASSPQDGSSIEVRNGKFSVGYR
jgi:hypothetical protein